MVQQIFHAPQVQTSVTTKQATNQEEYEEVIEEVTTTITTTETIIVESDKHVQEKKHHPVVITEKKVESPKIIELENTKTDRVIETVIVPIKTLYSPGNYIVVKERKTLKPNELSLFKDHQVYVLFMTSDGWCFAQVFFYF